MSLLNVGSRALLANQVALQTAGHNIANASVEGYSRQNVALETVPGQYTGSGYVGHGVDVKTILRNHDELLTRQSTAANATKTADVTRSERLSQMQDTFDGGTDGLGAAVSDMLNSLGDVASAPTDISARTVTLTRTNEMTARMRSAAQQLGEQEYSVNQQLTTDVTTINGLASSIANVNEQIARSQARGQPPNDLLDRRDQLIRDLNQYVQTSQVSASDGTVGVFVAGSQPLVLGSNATALSVAESTLFPGSGTMRLMFGNANDGGVELDENMLGGGQVSGLLRFSNTDLAEGRNLLGRMAQAIGMTMNAQQKLGLTLDGKTGSALFSVPTSAQSYSSGTGKGTVSFTSATDFAASDYEIRFTTPPAGQVVRLSDNAATSFSDLSDLASKTIDGLTFNMTAAGAAGERVLFKPFSASALNISSSVNSPRDLAAANPINASMGTNNAGTLQLAALEATGPTLTPPAKSDSSVTPAITGGVQLVFTAGPPATYSIYDGGTNPVTPLATDQPYTSGDPIKLNGWSITLQGTPKTGDTVTVGNALDSQYDTRYTRDAGNAKALMALRDVTMFDDATLGDGYAGLMAQVGTRTQSAKYASDLSTTIAANLESDRTAVSGVNLDEEAARLIQYQQAYQASAKVLQIAQGIFDSLIQTMGR